MPPRMANLYKNKTPPIMTRSMPIYFGSKQLKSNECSQYGTTKKKLVEAVFRQP